MKNIQKRKRIINLVFGIPPAIAFVCGLIGSVFGYIEYQELSAEAMVDDAVKLGLGLAGMLMFFILIFLAFALVYYCLLWRSVYHLFTSFPRSKIYAAVDIMTIIVVVLSCLEGVMLFAAAALKYNIYEHEQLLSIALLVTLISLVVIILLRLICGAVYELSDGTKNEPAAAPDQQLSDPTREA